MSNLNRAIATRSVASAAAPWLSDAPFTSNLIARFNNLTHYPRSLSKENAGFASEAAGYEESARQTLYRYGAIDSLDADLPEDVQKALDRLRRANYNSFVNHVRSRELAPPVTITGPANYHKFARPERAMNLERRSLDAVKAAQQRLERVIGRYSPNAAISSDDPDAPERIAERVRGLEAEQARMVAANKIFKSKKLDEAQKIASLAPFGIAESLAKSMLAGDFCGRIGYADYLLSNNRANITRLKQRQAEIIARRQQTTTETQIGDIRVVDNVEDNRLQVLFPGKPDADVREWLKKNGFKWAPTANAWQRFRNRYAREQVEAYLRGLGGA